MNRRNLIVFVCGRKGSGKSTLLHRAFTSQHPRVVSLDFTFTGETIERAPDAIPVFSLSELANELDRAARTRSWHIAAELSATEAVELFRIMAPTSRNTASYSKAVGGVAIECGEVDALAPVHGTADVIDNAFKRGRHFALSLFMGTQRPHSCARVVTSQADIVCAFQQHEPRDIKYLADTTSGPIAQAVRRLPRYWHVWYDAAAGEVYVRDEHGTTQDAFTTFGEPLT
jgi:hypothetical protein